METSDKIDLDFEWNGFLPIASTWNGEVNGRVSQNFDSDFFLISESVNGDSVPFDYDNDGLLIQVGTLSLTCDTAVIPPKNQTTQK